MSMQFQKATRTTAKIKVAVAGPSGSGKSLGALAIAKGLAGKDGKIAVIDTENGSASLYAEKYEFDVLDLGPPFTSARYLEAMRAAVDAGYTVLIVDSISHQWNGEGGILSRKEEADRRGGNSYTNWQPFSKEHTEFLSALLHLPVHVVVTLRSKQDYVLETNERGKATPKKVGMAPVQREGLEYEFTTVFELQMDHKAIASKDRTGLFADGSFDLLDGSKVSGRLVAWLGTSKAAPKATTTGDATSDQIGRLRFMLTNDVVTEDVRAKVESAIARGLTAETAEKWIAQIGAKVEEAMAADRVGHGDNTDVAPEPPPSDELDLGDGKCPECFGVNGRHRPDCPKLAAKAAMSHG